ncbi:MAG: amidase, partial [Dehalococcoidia bacterium]
GPLDGIPIAIKDLYDTAGAVTTGGTGAYRDRVPDEDATAVARLREAGAVILGKTNTHELAFGGTTNNIHYGATHNPWHLDRVPGGSSGGSGAALAARQAPAALGTDTGGSIRIPAVFCGVTGFKPTFGLVGRTGVIPLSLTLDHAGPMARSANDCALLLNPLQGYDERDLGSVERPAEDFTAGIDREVAGLRLAIVTSMLADAQPSVLEAFHRSLDLLRSLGVEIAEANPMGLHGDWRNDVVGIMPVEAYSYHQTLMDEEPVQIGPSTRRRIAVAHETTPQQYARALEMRKFVERRFERVLADERLDGYLAPTSPITAFPIDPDQERDDSPWSIFQNTTVFDLTHQPSISVPNGFDGDGLPTGLMISGAKWSDALVLRIGHAVQQATDWHTRKPAL